MTSQQYSGSKVDRLMNRFLGFHATIFTIHRPSPATGAYGGLDESLLKRCLDYARNKGYRFVSIDQLVKESIEGKDLDQPTICFTLDDGYHDQTTRLIPILLDYETAPTLFVITDFIDGLLWPWDAKLTHLLWNTPAKYIELDLGSQKLPLDLSSTDKRIHARRQVINTFKFIDPALHPQILNAIANACDIAIPSQAPQEFQPATWENLRQLEQRGLGVGSHSKTHLVFNAASDDAIKDELASAKARLMSELKRPSQVFCYPIGTRRDFKTYHPNLVRHAGHTAAITTISNMTSSQAIRENPFEIERIAFPNSFEKFARYTSWKEALRSKLPF